MADDPSSASASEQPAGFSRVLGHVSAHRVEAGLWLTRMFTVASTLFFFIPLLGGNPMTWYSRALISAAATSALRLHQRLPNFQLSREFLGVVALEDSAHYLFFSCIFLMSSPVSMALAPVFLFALLHSAAYSTTLCDLAGAGAEALPRKLTRRVQDNTQNMLRFVAMTEIFLMPVIVISIFTGSMSILQPFVYYRFMQLRYASRRNPYCRQLFYELRVALEHVAAKPSMPAFVGQSVRTFVGVVSRLAPPPQQQAPPPQPPPQS